METFPRLSSSTANGTGGFSRTASADRECVADRFRACPSLPAFSPGLSLPRSKETVVLGLRICSPGYAVARCSPGGRDRIRARRVATALDLRLGRHVRDGARAFYASIAYAGVLLSLGARAPLATLTEAVRETLADQFVRAGLDHFFGGECAFDAFSGCADRLLPPPLSPAACWPADICTFTATPLAF